MAQQNIGIGEANAKQGDTYFDAFTKIQSNFTDLYSKLPLNLVVVNKLEDFPDPIAGVINLEPLTEYRISAAVETENRFQSGSGSRITCSNPFGPALTYTGNGVMFSGVDVSFSIVDALLSAPNASQYFNFTGSASSVTFGVDTMTLIGGGKFGTFDGLRSFNVTNIAAFGLTDGITVTNAVDTTIFSALKVNFNTSETNFVGIELTTAVFNTLEISDLIVDAGSGSTGISGAASSVNISSGFIATIQRCEFSSNVTPLSGITNEDIRFSFLGNSNIPDSTIDANPYLTTSTTVPIATAGIYEKVNQNNWSFTEASRLSVSNDGDIENLMEIPVKVQINGSVTVEKVGGGSDLITARLVYNDDPSNPQSSVTEIGTDNTAPTNIGLTGIFILQPGDMVSMYVANQDSAADIVVDYAKFTLLRVL